MKQTGKMMMLALMLTCFGQTAWGYDVFVVGTGLTVTSPRMPEMKRTVEKIENCYKVSYELDSLVVMDDEEVSGANISSSPDSPCVMNRDALQPPGNWRDSQSRRRGTQR